jgi:hypothetical protein
VGIGTDDLVGTLSREAKLLSDLREILRDQREAVAAEDLTRVDDTIFSAQRIFRTLAEARTKRRTLLEILSGDPDIPLTEVETALGPRATPAVARALEDLRGVALELSADLEVNRQVLQGAIRSGEELIRALTGAGSEDAGTYGPKARASQSSGDHGLIINRQV